MEDEKLKGSDNKSVKQKKCIKDHSTNNLVGRLPESSRERRLGPLMN